VAALADQAAAAIVAAAGIALLVGLTVVSGLTHAHYEGPYEVLEEEHRWDLQEPDAAIAVYTKRLRVRFNYRTIAVIDNAWGESADLFAEYECRPGTLVSTRRDGPREYAIIALPVLRQKGDEETLELDRTVRNEFQEAQQWIEVEFANKSRRAVLEAIFPASRVPSNLQKGLGRRDSMRTKQLASDEHLNQAGRVRVRIEVNRPKRHQLLRSTWDW
jgi:hypothetical protein